MANTLVVRFLALSCLAAAVGCSSESPITAAAAPALNQAAALISNDVPSVKAAVAAPKPTPVAAAAPAFPVNGVLRAGRRLEHGDYMWEEDGVPPGKLTIVADLQAQVLYVYRGGVEIGRAAILYGADDKPTPTGTFTILQRKADHVSNLYGAPMPYMLRLTWDGIAIHGSEVEWGSATHGCLGVPVEFAKLLFERAKLGDPVLVTNRWRTDVYGA